MKMISDLEIILFFLQFGLSGVGWFAFLLLCKTPHNCTLETSLYVPFFSHADNFFVLYLYRTLFFFFFLLLCAIWYCCCKLCEREFFFVEIKSGSCEKSEQEHKLQQKYQLGWEFKWIITKFRYDDEEGDCIACRKYYHNEFYLYSSSKMEEKNLQQWKWRSIHFLFK